MRTFLPVLHLLTLWAVGMGEIQLRQDVLLEVVKQISG